MSTRAALALAAAALVVTAAPAQASYPVAQNGRILYAAGVFSSSQPEVFAVNQDGTGATNLTKSQTVGEDFPALSPNGRRLAFVRDDGQSAQVAIANADASGAKVLTSFPLVEPVTSPAFLPARAAGRIVFASDGGARDDLFLIRNDGSGLRNLTDTYFPVEETSPSPHPNGRDLVFSRCDSSYCAIVRGKADGSRPVPLTAPPVGVIDASPSVSPNGKRIAFARIDTNVGQIDVWIMNVDGSGETNLTDTPAPLFETTPAISPDGRTIAYATGTATERELATMNLDGSGKTNITNTFSMVERVPTWESIFLCRGRRATIVGSDGRDRLVGTRKRDVIVANGGRDTVIGNRGNDLICLGKGRDNALAGRGNDSCIGNQGKDEGTGCEKGKL